MRFANSKFMTDASAYKMCNVEQRHTFTAGNRCSLVANYHAHFWTTCRFGDMLRSSTGFWRPTRVTDLSLTPLHDWPSPGQKLTETQTLVAAFLSGDHSSLPPLHDSLVDGGETLLPFRIGERYVIETTSRWYLRGVVSEVGPFYVRLASGSFAHIRTLDFCRFAASDQPKNILTSVKMTDVVIPLFCVASYFQMPTGLLPEVGL